MNKCPSCEHDMKLHEEIDGKIFCHQQVDEGGYSVDCWWCDVDL